MTAIKGLDTKGLIKSIGMAGAGPKPSLLLYCGIHCKQSRRLSATRT